MGIRYGSPAHPFAQKLKNADALIVEADVSTSDTPFANLPTCEALEERINGATPKSAAH